MIRSRLRRIRIILKVIALVYHNRIVHLVHSQERDKDTINPVPHAVFKKFKYPKTGSALLALCYFKVDV